MMKKYKFEIYALITCIAVAIIAFFTSCASNKKLENYTQIDTIYVSTADTVYVSTIDTSYVEKIINHVDTFKNVEIRTITVNEHGDTIKDIINRLISEKLKESNTQNSNQHTGLSSIDKHEGIKNNSSVSNHELKKSNERPWFNSLQLIGIEILLLMAFAVIVKSK